MSAECVVIGQSPLVPIVTSPWFHVSGPHVSGRKSQVKRWWSAPEADATWRDYCVQFLGKCYPRINDAKSREAMADAMWEALRTTRRAGRAAGSAARQLMTLGRTFPEFPPEEVSAASLEALLDPASSDETRTVLLQVCGTLGEHGALPTARAIAGQNSTPVLRASAIAAVGMLGDDTDLPLLKRLAASGDVRVSVPARAALGRLQKRH